MSTKRRPHGTGGLYQKDGAWYGRWRDGEGRHARKLGWVKVGSRGEGLTKGDAEAKLRELLLVAESRRGRSVERTTVAELAPAFMERLRERGRKASHLRTTSLHLSAHVVPSLGEFEVRDLVGDDVRRFVSALNAKALSPKMVRNVVGTLYGLLRLGVDRGLLERNPAEGVELPPARRSEEIHFLALAELDRLLAAQPVQGEGVTRAEIEQWPVLRLLILTAAMTGLRLGELRGLQWQDLDFGASKVRVRRNFVRGEVTTPKSRRGSRGVPLASRLVEELEVHHRRTVWNQDDDLVLAHPHTGKPLSETRLRQHYAAAVARAGCVTSGFMTCGTRSPPPWPRAVRRRYGRCRSGWATETFRRL